MVLFKTLSCLIHRLKSLAIDDYEIIVVNDGSTDNSFAEALRFKIFNGNSYKVKLYNYTKNIGKGFALRYGFSKSKGDPVIFLDGDMDIDTIQIVKALQLFWRTQPDMVIASKYHPRSRIYYPLNRYLYSLGLKSIIRLLFNLSISDTQVGLKVFRREVLSTIFPRLIIKRFAVDLELLVVANMTGFTKITEMPVIIKHTSANLSSINLWAVKNFCQDIAAIFYRKQMLHYYDTETHESIAPALNIQTA